MKAALQSELDKLHARLCATEHIRMPSSACRRKKGGKKQRMRTCQPETPQPPPSSSGAPPPAGGAVATPEHNKSARLGALMLASDATALGAGTGYSSELRKNELQRRLAGAAPCACNMAAVLSVDTAAPPRFQRPVRGADLNSTLLVARVGAGTRRGRGGGSRAGGRGGEQGRGRAVRRAALDRGIERLWRARFGSAPPTVAQLEAQQRAAVAGAAGAAGLAAADGAVPTAPAPSAHRVLPDVTPERPAIRQQKAHVPPQRRKHAGDGSGSGCSREVAVLAAVGADDGFAAAVARPAAAPLAAAPAGWAAPTVDPTSVPVTVVEAEPAEFEAAMFAPGLPAVQHSAALAMRARGARAVAVATTSTWLSNKRPRVLEVPQTAAALAADPMGGSSLEAQAADGGAFSLDAFFADADAEADAGVGGWLAPTPPELDGVPLPPNL
jgi:hypothetical protein